MKQFYISFYKNKNRKLYLASNQNYKKLDAIKEKTQSLRLGNYCRLVEPVVSKPRPKKATQ